MEHYCGYRTHRESGRVRPNSGVIPGLVLVAVGALFFLNNLHIFYVREWIRF